jgi:CheY-like chemotaxis protein
LPPVALVVDDSMLARHSVSRFLEEHGFVVESVSNGQEALDKLANFRPNLIVTDMKMPGMSGSELIRALKTNRRTAGIPIIIVAARQSGVDPNSDGQADYAIYKDIDVESQLDKALAALFGTSDGRG